MANISSATGTLVFKNFSKEDKKQFLEHMSDNYYGIDWYDWDEQSDDNYVDFTGSGRWSFDNTLKIEKYDFLKDNQYIQIDFYDIEPGCELYCYEEGVITKEGYNATNTVRYTQEEAIDDDSGDFEEARNDVFIQLEDDHDIEYDDENHIWEIDGIKYTTKEMLNKFLG